MESPKTAKLLYPIAFKMLNAALAEITVMELTTRFFNLDHI
jgi:hypothetical protein